MELANRLRERRKNKGLTQEELADRVGVSQGQISSYERGENEPTGTVLRKLAKELAVSSDYLLGDTDYPYVNTPLHEEDLTPRERELVMAFRRGDLQELIGILAQTGEGPKN